MLQSAIQLRSSRNKLDSLSKLRLLPCYTSKTKLQPQYKRLQIWADHYMPASVCFHKKKTFLQIINTSQIVGVFHFYCFLKDIMTSLVDTICLDGRGSSFLCQLLTPQLPAVIAVIAVTHEAARCHPPVLSVTWSRVVAPNHPHLSPTHWGWVSY